MRKLCAVLLTAMLAVVLSGCFTKGIDPVMFEKQLEPLHKHHMKLMPNEPDDMKREDATKGWDKVFSNLDKAKGGDA